MKFSDYLKAQCGSSASGTPSCPNMARTKKKKCSRCGKRKPTSEFYVRKARDTEYIHPECKKCSIELNRIYRKNKMKFAEYLMMPVRSQYLPPVLSSKDKEVMDVLSDMDWATTVQLVSKIKITRGAMWHRLLQAERKKLVESKTVNGVRYWRKRWKIGLGMRNT